MGGEPLSDNGISSTQVASLDTTSLPDEEVPIDNKLILNDIPSTDVTTPDENTLSFGDATTEFGSLGISVTGRSLSVKLYTTASKKKTHFLEDEVRVR